MDNGNVPHVWEQVIIGPGPGFYVFWGGCQSKHDLSLITCQGEVAENHTDNRPSFKLIVPIDCTRPGFPMSAQTHLEQMGFHYLLVPAFPFMVCWWSRDSALSYLPGAET